MTATGYVNMSVKPEAKRALELLALDLSKELGRRVTLSEALEMGMRALLVNEVDVAEGADYRVEG
ncbi:MAG TPA: hypothetical protein VFX60_19285 [Micromonospora sp.]|nr:hypothetical protein [Micromonospora sp.]